MLHNLLPFQETEIFWSDFLAVQNPLTMMNVKGELIGQTVSEVGLFHFCNQRFCLGMELCWGLWSEVVKRSVQESLTKV